MLCVWIVWIKQGCIEAENSFEQNVLLPVCARFHQLRLVATGFVVDPGSRLAHNLVWESRVQYPACQAMPERCLLHTHNIERVIQQQIMNKTLKSGHGFSVAHCAFPRLQDRARVHPVHRRSQILLHVQ